MVLKDILTLRNILIVQIKSITTAMKELKHVSTSPSLTKATAKLLQLALEGLNESLKKVEKEIKETLSKDDVLYDIYKRLVTVPGLVTSLPCI